MQPHCNLTNLPSISWQAGRERERTEQTASQHVIRGPERMMRGIKTDTEIEKVMCVELCVSKNTTQHTKHLRAWVNIFFLKTSPDSQNWYLLQGIALKGVSIIVSIH